MRKIIFILLMLLAALPAGATNWYLDPNASGTNAGTSWTNAWETVGTINWASIMPGDTLYISGGSTSQTYTSALGIGASGTSGNPITVSIGQDSGHTGTAIFDAGGSTTPMINFYSYQYVTLTGNYGGARNIILQNGSLATDNALLSGEGAGCSTYPCPSSDFSQSLKVLYIEVKNSGDGINIEYPEYVEIAHNYVHNITCDHAIGVNGSADFSPGTLWGVGGSIHDNIIEVNNSSVSNPNTGDGPDAIQITSGVDVYNNTIYGAQGTQNCGQHQDGVQWDGNYERVYANSFYCLANSVDEGDQYDKTTHTAADGHFWFYNNLIGQCAGQSNSHGWEVVTHTTGSGSNLAVTNITDYQFWNNTFTDLTGYDSIDFLDMANTITLTSSSIENNIFYNVGAVMVITAGNYTCGTDFVIAYNNINNGMSGGGYTTNQCGGSNYNPTNTQTAAPVFTTYSQYGAGSNTLTLQSGSTGAIGTGLNLYSDFTTDYAGTSRPSTGAWTMGAYQYGSTPATPSMPPLNKILIAKGAN